jgi:hypothetical protein
MVRSITNNAVAVTPHDTNELAQPGVLYVGTGGAVKVKTQAGDTVLFGNVPDGYELKCIVVQVFDTDTDATDLVLYFDE